MASNDPGAVSDEEIYAGDRELHEREEHERAVQSIDRRGVMKPCAPATAGNHLGGDGGAHLAPFGTVTLCRRNSGEFGNALSGAVLRTQTTTLMTQRTRPSIDIISFSRDGELPEKPSGETSFTTPLSAQL